MQTRLSKRTANEDGICKRVDTLRLQPGEFTINNATVKSENNAYTANRRRKKPQRAWKAKNLQGVWPAPWGKGTIDAAKATPTFEISVPAVMKFGLTITFATGDVPENERELETEITQNKQNILLAMHENKFSCLRHYSLGTMLISFASL
ncbi:MAG: hypothetical protein ACLULL_06100 [Parabacteroides distasonis]